MSSDDGLAMGDSSNHLSHFILLSSLTKDLKDLALFFDFELLLCAPIEHVLYGLIGYLFYQQYLSASSSYHLRCSYSTLQDNYLVVKALKQQMSYVTYTNTKIG